MVGESAPRKIVYLNKGCFNEKKNQLNPISIFTEEDIWNYIKKFDLKYCSVYDKGETRTGCIFCMFGITHEEPPNRFQRLAISHPVQHKFCIEKLGCGRVLDYLGINYYPEEKFMRNQEIINKIRPFFKYNGKTSLGFEERIIKTKPDAKQVNDILSEQGITIEVFKDEVLSRVEFELHDFFQKNKRNKETGEFETLENIKKEHSEIIANSNELNGWKDFDIFLEEFYVVNK